MEGALSWAKETNSSQTQEGWKKEERGFSSFLPPSHRAGWRSTSGQGDACVSTAGPVPRYGYSFAWAWRMLIPSVNVDFPHHALANGGFWEVKPVISFMHGLLPQLMANGWPPRIFKPPCHSTKKDLDRGTKSFMGQDSASSWSPATHAMVLLVWHRNGMCAQPWSSQYGAQAFSRLREWQWSWGRGRVREAMQGGMAVGGENPSLGGRRRQTWAETPSPVHVPLSHWT